MAKKNKNPSVVSGGDVDENVDKIREILFGGQMRDYEQRFVELERRLAGSLDELTTKFEKRLDKLDGYAKQQVDKLNEQLKAERKARLDDGKSSTREISGLSDQFDKRCAELESQIDAESDELRGFLREQGNEMSGLISETHDELSKTIANETRQIADDKIAREDLAGLFTELASRLKKDAKPSKK